MTVPARSSGLRLDLVAGYFQIGALLVGNFVAIGVIVRSLSLDSSAAWSLLYSVMSAIELTAFGLGLPLVNGIARARTAVGQRAVLRRVLVRASVLCSLIAAGIVVGREPVGTLLTQLFGSVGSTVTGLSVALPWVIVAALLKSVGYLATFAFTGLGQVYVTRLYQGAYGLAPVLGAIAVSVAGADFWLLFAAVQVWQLLVLVVLGIHLANQSGAAGETSASDDWSGIGTTALRYLFVLISNQSILVAGGFVVAAVAAPSDVLAYVLAWRLVSVIANFVNVIPSSLWPRMASLEHAESHTSNDLIGRATLATTVFASAAALLFAWQAQWVISAWAGPAVYAGPAVVALLGVYLLGQGVGQTALNLAVARNLSIRVVVEICIYALGQVLMCVAMGRLYGTVGVAAAAGIVTVVAYAYFAVLVPARFGFSMSTAMRNAVWMQFLLGALALAGVYGSQTLLTSSIHRLSAGAAILVAWGAAAWVSAPARERAGMLAFLR